MGQEELWAITSLPDHSPAFYSEQSLESGSGKKQASKKQIVSQSFTEIRDEGALSSPVKQNSDINGLCILCDMRSPYSGVNG